MGRRITVLELYKDPQAFHDLIKAQSFQSGRSPDELTRRLEASWRELRARRGRPPKLQEVAKAAGGKWSDTDACWQFVAPATYIRMTQPLRERLKESAGATALNAPGTILGWFAERPLLRVRAGGAAMR